MKLKSLFLFVLLITAQALQAQTYPKREFRGAWMPTVTNLYTGMSTRQMQDKLISELDLLHAAGINAILFQVRPEGDAFYNSPFEPWSRFLTGTQGKAPDPYWDPMAFMVEQCHKRGMEFHAWVNPFRAKTNLANNLAPNHIYYQHPEWFLQYDNKLYFNPASVECRKYIGRVITDIVARYDIDAIHFDDYFYPYPVAGEEFPDEADYQQSGSAFANKGDWRRDNINQFMKRLHARIRALKPWVKFGVSPFGVYRNQKSDPLGSHTQATQAYDDLYADVLLWAREGWIDYNIPQIYWQVGHPVADYQVLVDWWAHHSENCPLFIGQRVTNTIENADPQNPLINQLSIKTALQRSYQTIGGSCQYQAQDIVTNKGNYFYALRDGFNKYPALIPAFTAMDKERPDKVRKVKKVHTSDGLMLFWTAPKAKTEMDRAVQYVVYAFRKGEEEDLNDPSKIICITANNYCPLPYVDGSRTYHYYITAVDRLHNESRSVSKKVKL